MFHKLCKLSKILDIFYDYKNQLEWNLQTREILCSDSVDDARRNFFLMQSIPDIFQAELNFAFTLCCNKDLFSVKSSFARKLLFVSFNLFYKLSS